MTDTIQEKIELIKTHRSQYNLQNQKPIEATYIEEFTKKFQETFKYDVDAEYLEFLKICDGLEDNGFKIFSSKNRSVNSVPYGIFENNEYFYEQDEDDRKYILFATSGQDLFVFDKELKKYQLLDRYSADVIEEYDSFDTMLFYILRLMLNEEVE